MCDEHFYIQILEWFIPPAKGFFLLPSPFFSSFLGFVLSRARSGIGLLTHSCGAFWDGSFGGWEHRYAATTTEVRVDTSIRTCACTGWVSATVACGEGVKKRSHIRLSEQMRFLVYDIITLIVVW